MCGLIQHLCSGKEGYPASNTFIEQLHTIGFGRYPRTTVQPQIRRSWEQIEDFDSVDDLTVLTNKARKHTYECCSRVSLLSALACGTEQRHRAAITRKDTMPLRTALQAYGLNGVAFVEATVASIVPAEQIHAARRLKLPELQE